MENSDNSTTRFLGRLTIKPFFYFMRYITSSQRLVLVNPVRDDMTLIPELSWSTARNSPLIQTIEVKEEPYRTLSFFLLIQLPESFIHLF